jgi:hypothetical protein
VRADAKRRNAPPADADLRPTLIAAVTLLFLLMSFLLTTTAGQRLGVLDLELAEEGDVAAVPSRGVLSNLELRVDGSDVQVRMAIATTDIAAASTARETRAYAVPAVSGRLDAGRLGAILAEAKAMDPSAESARIVPTDGTPAASVVAVLDTVRGTPGSPLFPRAELR